MDKQIGKLKNVDPKHTPKESVNKDNKDNMVKEANDNSKPKTPKTPKQQRISTTQCEDISKTVTCKRNATKRSPLEGNPGKKQKEGTIISQNQESDGKKELQDEDLNTDRITDETQNILIETQQKKLKRTQNMAKDRTQTQYYKTS